MCKGRCTWLLAAAVAGLTTGAQAPAQESVTGERTVVAPKSIVDESDLFARIHRRMSRV